MSNSILINAIGACIICLGIGYLFGFMVFGMPKLPQKEYPIEVLTYTNRKDIIDYTTVDADSVKGDSIYKDGLIIVNKNIVNITFK